MPADFPVWVLHLYVINNITEKKKEIKKKKTDEEKRRSRASAQWINPHLCIYSRFRTYICLSKYEYIISMLNKFYM